MLTRDHIVTPSRYPAACKRARMASSSSGVIERIIGLVLCDQFVPRTACTAVGGHFLAIGDHRGPPMALIGYQTTPLQALPRVLFGT